MSVISTRCCGTDVHKKQITVSTLVSPADGKAKTSTRRRLASTPAGNGFQDQAIEVVVMESTGQYWRPVWTIIAEVSADTETFKTVNHLASWSCLAPKNNEPSGMVKCADVTNGNKYLKTAMVTAAMGAKRKREGGLKDFFYRLASRMGNRRHLWLLPIK